MMRMSYFTIQLIKKISPKIDKQHQVLQHSEKENINQKRVTEKFGPLQIEPRLAGQKEKKEEEKNNTITQPKSTTVVQTAPAAATGYQTTNHSTHFRDKPTLPQSTIRLKVIIR